MEEQKQHSRSTKAPDDFFRERASGQSPASRQQVIALATRIQQRHTAFGGRVRHKMAGVAQRQSQSEQPTQSKSCWQGKQQGEKAKAGQRMQQPPMSERPVEQLR